MKFNAQEEKHMSTLVYSSLTEREFKNYKRKVRRQREIRNKIVLTIITVVLVLTAVLSVQSLTSQAHDENMEVTYKYFTSHEVVQGDSLWSIAEEYIDYTYYADIQEYVEELIDINNLPGDEILLGQCIVVPYFSNTYH